MVSQKRGDAAAVLLEGWLSSTEGKSAGADFVSKRLAELRQKEENEKGVAISSFGKERLEAIAKLPAELEVLSSQARTAKNTGKILNRIRDIRRGLAGSQADTALMLQLDRTEALALNGQREPRKALGLLDDAWARNSKAMLESKEPALVKAACELAGDALGFALDAGNHPSAVVWAARIAGESFPAGEAGVDLLKGAAIRLVLADAKSEGIAVLSILEKQMLARLPDDSQIRKKETASVARLYALCANGAAVIDDKWFVGEMPKVQTSAAAKKLFQADLLFAARETQDASRAYLDVTRLAGIDIDAQGYATLQLARCLAALGEYEEARRTYERFEDKLAGTKSAAPALLRAGTLACGPMNDSRSAQGYFAMVSTRYPNSPEAELCDWYIANLLLWDGDLRASRTAFDLFERKYPTSAFLTALDQSIRPQLAQR